MGPFDFPATITLIVFASVILLIAFDLIDMMLAALMGVSTLIVLGIFTAEDVISISKTAEGTIALLFGGMVVARTLVPTGIFEYIGTAFLRATRGSGKRFLLGLFVLVAPLCAVLPNATTVIILAPIIIRVATALEIDFVGPLLVTAIISNSAGMLTLVGDPATFLVGSSIGMTFSGYLQKVSLGGLLALLSIIPLMPKLMKNIWQVRRPLPVNLRAKPLERPWFAAFSLMVLLVMVLLFIFGDKVPWKIVPPGVAIIAATLALLVIYAAKVEPLTNVLKDIDWQTIIFLTCLFCLVQAFTKTGILETLSQNLYTWFGTNLVLISLIIIGGVGFSSSLLANIPIVAAMLLMVKGYMVIAQLVPDLALDPTFIDWPARAIPVFVAMMFAATLGGNATLIGASANVVSTGICAANGKPVSFVTFMRYGIPVTLCQLAVAALYVLGMFYFVGR
ncbi:MAG: SLC13 family permease [Thermodesulfobacteriota bacterium]|jgi:Na+/H+ antiporter NhaD/arsenite permease-like protein|nr:MAG: SLC13 family permease [Thermodesulfobacteriota bacterium]